MKLSSSIHNFHPDNEWLIPDSLLARIPSLSNAISQVKLSSVLDDLHVWSPTDNGILSFNDALRFLRPQENQDPWCGRSFGPRWFLHQNLSSSGRFIKIECPRMKRGCFITWICSYCLAPVMKPHPTSSLIATLRDRFGPGLGVKSMSTLIFSMQNQSSVPCCILGASKLRMWSYLWSSTPWVPFGFVANN